MARRYFSVAEVEGLIPTLERIFTHVLQLRGALRVQERALEKAGVPLSRELLDDDEAPAIAGAAGAGPGPARSAGKGDKTEPREKGETRTARALFRAYYEALAEELARVVELGGEVKDLDTGLVDFPGLRGKDEILLCWKLGERRLGFWHTPEAGYAGRRPIDDQVPREPTRLD